MRPSAAEWKGEPATTALPDLARTPPRLTRGDLAGMLAGFLYTLVLVLVLSRGRIFWEDETLGWMLLHDPSWHHMLRAYNLGADGGGFLFYLLGRGWFALFGPSALAFRLFSATCFGLAFAVTWAAARRFYTVGVVAFALANTWFFSPPFVQHMAEGRFYGLLILSFSLTLWLTLALAETPSPTPRRLYPVAFLANAALSTSHLLGAVFSAFLLAALVVLDLRARRPRPGLYLCAAASWLLLIPERFNIRASAAVGRPHFWTKAPHPFDILSVYTGSSKEIALVLAVLLLLALWSRRAREANLPRPPGLRRPVYIVLAAVFLVPVAFFLQGLAGGTWLFNDRYLLPVTVAVAYLTAELTARAAPAFSSFFRKHRRAKGSAYLAGAAIFLPALLFWDFHHLADFSPSPQDFTAQLTAELPRGVPVVCEDAFSFTELISRQHASGVPFFYLLDWPQSVSPSAPPLEVTQYHLMRNWRRAGYFSGSIEPIDEFLRTHNHFFVLHEQPRIPTGLPPEIGNPLAARLARDPAYQVLPYLHLTHGKYSDTVWQVDRRATR